MKTIGIVDYGIGNHASVATSLRKLGYRVKVTAEPGVLDVADVLVLPGVGAFPPAMEALHRHDLVNYLRAQAKAHRPIIGVCLGMQLLATASYEHHYTSGLDLIPGEIHPMDESRWHIGWNTIECVKDDTLLGPSNGQAFYFNHSFVYQGPAQYRLCVSRHPAPMASVIRSGNIIGVQFHPEKSQAAGKELLCNLIEGLADA